MDTTDAAPFEARPLADYHEDMGPVLWWKFPIVEPPYVGTPNDVGFTIEAHTRTRLISQVDQKHAPTTHIERRNFGGWPGYHTHFTQIPIPQIGTSNINASAQGWEPPPFLNSLRKTAKVMRSAHDKGGDRLMSIWTEDVQGVEEAIQFLESSSAVERLTRHQSSER